jgi:hypothetical protein
MAILKFAHLPAVASPGLADAVDLHVSLQSLVQDLARVDLIRAGGQVRLAATLHLGSQLPMNSTDAFRHLLQSVRQWLNLHSLEAEVIHDDPGQAPLVRYVTVCLAT